MIGNICPCGVDCAKKEVIVPRRNVTSFVKVTKGRVVYVAVKNVTDIPKGLILSVWKKIRRYL